MKETGIVRKVDELGRIVLPIELRETMQIKNKEEMAFYLKDDVIVLKKKETVCCLCGSKTKLREFNGEKVCRACLDDLQSEK